MKVDSNLKHAIFLIILLIIMIPIAYILVEKHEAKCISKGGETKLVYGKIRCIN